MTGLPLTFDAFFTVVIGASCDFVSIDMTLSRSRATLVTEPEELESDTTGTGESTIEIAGVDTALTATSTLVLTGCSVTTGCSLIIFSSALRCSFLKQEQYIIFGIHSWVRSSQINVRYSLGRGSLRRRRRPSFFLSGSFFSIRRLFLVHISRFENWLQRFVARCTAKIFLILRDAL